MLPSARASRNRGARPIEAAVLGSSRLLFDGGGVTSLLLFGLVLSSGCSKAEKAEPVPTVVRDDGGVLQPITKEGEMSALGADGQRDAGLVGKEARDLYTARCVMCHGWEGRGDGPSSRMLGTGLKLPDFTNAAWQKTEKDETWMSVIVKGGEATGHSRLMPANPDLEGKPEVAKDLVRLLRSFSGRP